MKEVIKKEILFDLDKAIEILEKKDIEELKKLSDHAIDDVALYKNLDLISVTVLIYSIYKIFTTLPKEDHLDILKELKEANKHLQENNFHRYNKSIKTIFNVVKRSNPKIRKHLQDVMHAARIKKSAILLEKGLSIGQAAGLMGLSNWDLQDYAAKRTSFGIKGEKVSVKKRLLTAFKIFGV